MAKLGPLLGVVVALSVVAAGFDAAGEPRGMPGPSHLPAQALYQRLYQASVRVSRAVQRMMQFEVIDADAAIAEPYAEAAVSAADALVAIAALPDGRRRLAAIHSVRVVRDLSPGASVEGGTLVITVNPSMGDAGRPTSADIVRAIRAATLERMPTGFAIAPLNPRSPRRRVAAVPQGGPAWLRAARADVPASR
jgi:hypothetical protein